MVDIHLTARGSFYYPLQLVPAAALNAQIQGFVKVLQDADFELHSIQYLSTGNFSLMFGTITIWFMNDFVRAANILGTGQFRNMLDEPYLFPRGSSISVLVRNDTGNANTVDLAFQGRLVPYAG